MSDFSGYGFSFSNLKCFGEEPQGFDSIKPINLIIGRNNSGKSTLLDLLPSLVATDFELPHQLSRSPGKPLQVYLSATLTDELFEKRFSSKEYGGAYSRWNNLLDFARQYLREKRLVVKFRHKTRNGFDFVSVEDESEFAHLFTEQGRQDYCSRLSSTLWNPFTEHHFFRINPERRLRPESDSKELPVSGDGIGGTNIIQQFLNKLHLPRDLVRKTLLWTLNEIVHPDAYFREILTRQNDQTGEWEVYLDEEGKGQIPLSASGHGLQTVILVLIHTILLSYGEPNLNRHIFAFEELENNLHPSLFRRLLGYIRKIAVEQGATFFITTHSHLAIDLFRDDPISQLIHVTHDGKEARCRVLSSYIDHNEVLDDLEVRASDILQANGIVWVEGPSDRIYLNRWIEIASEGKFKEGLHYQCLAYGGASLAGYSAVPPDSDDENDQVQDAVKMFTLNRNAVVVMDSDKTRASSELKKRVARIKGELEQIDVNLAWITQGREVENYLPKEALISSLKLIDSPKIGRYSNAFDQISKVHPRKTKYAKRKVELAKAVAPFIVKENWGVLDLEERILKLCELIKRWNSTPETA